MSAHGHGHHHSADFDWEAMAESLEIDGTLALPLVETVVTELVAPRLDLTRVAHAVDVGCGPGVITCALAGHLPAATVTGLDSAGPLLQRLRRRATATGLGNRVEGLEADLEHELPVLPPADLVWASMVVHHVADRPRTLRLLAELLRPGGMLVMIEFAGSPRVLPDDDPLVTGGVWRRLEEAARATLLLRLGFDAIGHDWPADLARVGLTDIDDRVVAFRHDAPLDEIGRRWLARHVRRGSGMAGDALDAADASALEAFATAVENGDRIDPFVVAERRVLTARRSSRAR